MAWRPMGGGSLDGGQPQECQPLTRCVVFWCFFCKIHWGRKNDGWESDDKLYYYVSFVKSWKEVRNQGTIHVDITLHAQHFREWLHVIFPNIAIYCAFCRAKCKGEVYWDMSTPCVLLFQREEDSFWVTWKGKTTKVESWKRINRMEQ